MTESAEYQPGPDTEGANASPVLEHLRKVAEEMREKLDACRKRDGAPKVEAVHHLRTGTRRVEATLETLAREAGARGLGQAAEELRQRWLRQLKKVRRAAGMVRDLDVHRDLLAENFLPAADTAPDAVARKLAAAVETAAAGSGEETPLIAQARALDSWLKVRRSAAAEALCGTLDDHASRLLDAEQQFMAAVAQRRSILRRVHRPAVRLALEDYLRLMDAMPLLDKENLHDFRKGAKKARYVAESDDSDPAAEAMAKAVKRVQDAIGDWHDWEVVAEEADEALGSGGALLQGELRTRAERAYERALRVTASMGRCFIGEWRAVPPRRARAPRVTSRKSS
ncbi:MAG TPA: CHAD domain-containing protein [Acidobacteriaceae bacterium]|jgi:CHAD domain-containing protein